MGHVYLYIPAYCFLLIILYFLYQRPYTVLGELASEVGWKYKDIVEKLEAKRKIRSAAYYRKKRVFNQKRTTAKVAIEAKLPENTRTILASVAFK